MIIGGSGNPKLAQRVRAHQDVMLEHGLGFETLKVESGIATPHGMSHHGDRANGAATQNFSALLLQRSAGTGHYPGRYELGRKVPADFAIAGFGDIAYAALATPALTTVRLDKREIGRASTRLLIDKINNPSRDFPVTESFPELIVREST